MWIGVAGICERIGCLPSAGGLFDQDPRHVRRLEKVFQAVGIKEKEDIEKETQKHGA